MGKTTIIAYAVMTIVGLSTAASAYTITYANILNADDYPSAVPDVTENTFNTYLGLWGGAIDGYNQNRFTKDGVTTLTLSWQDVINPNSANGNQASSSTNGYVNFAVGTVVPEPGTMVLLGFGLLSLAVYGKRRMNKEE